MVAIDPGACQTLSPFTHISHPSKLVSPIIKNNHAIKIKKMIGIKIVRFPKSKKHEPCQKPTLPVVLVEIIITISGAYAPGVV